jgi:hypothetical protein
VIATHNKESVSENAESQITVATWLDISHKFSINNYVKQNENMFPHNAQKYRILICCQQTEMQPLYECAVILTDMKYLLYIIYAHRHTYIYFQQV